MYIAEKGNLRCRIPENKVKPYEFLGYKCTEIKPYTKTDKKSKASKQEHTES